MPTWHVVRAYVARHKTDMPESRCRLRFPVHMCALAATIVAAGTVGRPQSMLTGAEAAPVEDRRRRMVVAAYVPEYRSGIDWEFVAGRATDLILFSAEPTETGEIKSFFPLDKADKDSGLSKALKARESTRGASHLEEGAEGVRLLLCLGGAGRSAAFADVAASQELRKTLIGNVAALVAEHELQGVDLDWEVPRTHNQVINYAMLIEEMAQELHSRGMILTATIHPWQDLGPPSYAALDRVHLMSYDAQGKHAMYATAQEDVKRLEKYGCPRAKIVLGIPFYARGVDRPDMVFTYADLVKKVGADLDPTRDLLGKEHALYFNNVLTCQKKTKWALRRGLGGVMVWEAGQDTTDPDTSLLAAISDAKLGITKKGRYKKKDAKSDPRLQRVREAQEKKAKLAAEKRRNQRKKRRKRRIKRAGIDL